MKRKLLPAAALLFGALMTGCAMDGAVLARVAPPPPRYAVVGVAPHPGFLWTSGNWDWRGGRWGFERGRWRY